MRDGEAERERDETLNPTSTTATSCMGYNEVHMLELLFSSTKSHRIHEENILCTYELTNANTHTHNHNILTELFAI